MADHAGGEGAGLEGRGGVGSAIESSERGGDLALTAAAPATGTNIPGAAGAGLLGGGGGGEGGASADALSGAERARVLELWLAMGGVLDALVEPSAPTRSGGGGHAALCGSGGTEASLRPPSRGSPRLPPL
jgi:hypothetical protein